MTRYGILVQLVWSTFVLVNSLLTKNLMEAIQGRGSPLLGQAGLRHLDALNNVGAGDAPGARRRQLVGDTP
jgi:hypothetical protein